MPAMRTLSRFLVEAQGLIRLQGQVSVLLTTDREIRRLNRTFRGKNKATDVLSFPALDPSQVSKTGRPGAPSESAGPRVQPHRGRPMAAAPVVIGDLAISVETARAQAAEYGHALAVELKVLMLHGLLHLAGFDHEADEGEMALRESALRVQLGLTSGLIERSGLHSPAAEKRRKKKARVGGAKSVARPAGARKAGSPTARIAGAGRSAQADKRRGRRA